MAISSEKRKLSRERKLVRAHSRWLQKVLFALSKAEAEQEKLEKLRGEGGDPVAVTINGATYPIEDVTTAIRTSVDEWLQPLRASKRALQDRMMR